MQYWHDSFMCYCRIINFFPSNTASYFSLPQGQMQKHLALTYCGNR
jgi:hypothetical protein